MPAARARREDGNPVTVENLLDEVVQRVKDGTPVAVPLEIERIVRRLKKDNPDALFEWFEEHMRDALGRVLQSRLASLRTTARRRRSSTVFREHLEQYEEDEAVGPLEEPVYVGGSWKSIGDAVRKDLDFLIEDRRSRATAHVFDILLVKAYRDRLSDDKTRVRDVFTVEEAAALGETLNSKAQKMVGRL